MKKLFMLLTCFVVVLGLSACSSPASSDLKDNNEKSNVVEDSTSKTNETDVSSSSTGKFLVVYFSATGNTEKVANMIADVSDADLFKIEPAPEYTSGDLNWNDANSRVSREHNDVTLRNVELQTTAVDNWDSYETVFIGYPIWWGGAAWPIDTFVRNNDFNGKTVIPFATSASSGIGNSAKDLYSLTNSGEWLEGKRFSSSASEEEVDSWIKELGILAN